MLMSVRAIATRCFMPPESSLGYFFAESARPTASRYLAACAARSCRATPRSLSPYSTFSRTVSQPNDVYAWKTMPRSRPTPLDALAVDEDLALGRRQQAGDRLQDRRFAAARRPEEDDDLADARLVGDVEVDAAHRLDVVAATASDR